MAGGGLDEVAGGAGVHEAPGSDVGGGIGPAEQRPGGDGDVDQGGQWGLAAGLVERRPGRRAVEPGRDGPSRDGPGPGDRTAQLAELLAGLNAAPEPIAREPGDHGRREDRYTPSRRLKHLIRARTARCSAPGCGAQALTSEIDHTIPYPAGATCEGNLGPLSFV